MLVAPARQGGAIGPECNHAYLQTGARHRGSTRSRCSTSIWSCQSGAWGYQTRAVSQYPLNYPQMPPAVNGCGRTLLEIKNPAKLVLTGFLGFRWTTSEAFMVPLTGIEPVSSAEEALVLSIELQGEDRTKIIAAIPPTNNLRQRPGESKFASERRVYQTRPAARRAAKPVPPSKRPSGHHPLGRTNRPAHYIKQRAPVQSSSLRIPPPRTPPC
jgi:hypothetical protein